MLPGEPGGASSAAELAITAVVISFHVKPCYNYSIIAVKLLDLEKKPFFASPNEISK